MKLTVAQERRVAEIKAGKTYVKNCYNQTHAALLRLGVIEYDWSKLGHVKLTAGAK